jgi:NADH dehydrogenase [ubiquinone] 1 alpha subcomplex assembly factor 1
MLTQLCRQSLVKNATASCLRSIHTTAVNETFWEREKKSGYGKKLSVIPTKAMILDGLKELRNEMKLWTEEVKEKFDTDPIMVFRPGEVDIAWKFSGWLRDF